MAEDRSEEIRSILTGIDAGTGTKTGLSALRAILRDLHTDDGTDSGGGQESFRRIAEELTGRMSQWLDLLKDPDPKVRKNAALLIGDLLSARAEHTDGADTLSADAGKELWSAYRREETLYVKSAYLTAMRAVDLAPYQALLAARLAELAEHDWSTSEIKHIREERRAIEELLGSVGRQDFHHFHGLHRSYEMLLTCDLPVRERALHELQGTRIVAGGVRASVSSWSALQRCRLYREALFLVPLRKGFAANETTIGTLPENSRLLPLLDSIFDGEPTDTYAFRLEIRSARKEDRLGAFLRLKAAEIEESSKGRLRNVPGNYEFTLILLRKESGSFTPFIRLSDDTDRRFSYRKDIEPTSMVPVMAAEAIELAKDYLKPGAWVIDPFCGVGTLLIERALAVRASELYGTDIYGHAILGARRNAKRADVDAHFINRDFFDFTHEKAFDEVLAEFPDLYGKEQAERDAFYGKAFQRSILLTGRGGVFIFLSGEEALMHKHIRLHPNLSLEAKIELRKRETIYIIRRGSDQ